MSTSRYAITFGESAILHVGSKPIGKRNEDGYSVEELQSFAEKHPNSEFIMLSDHLDEEDRIGNEAGILILRNALKTKYADDLLKEQEGIEYDKKFFSRRTKSTLNKRARYNIVFTDKTIAHSDDYMQHSSVSFESLPNLNKLRKKLPTLLNSSAKNLYAEGNHYYEKKSQIGFHGDTERKIVICLSLGKSGNLIYQWRKKKEDVKDPITIKVHHGDIYIMSEKATGYDWLCRSKIRVVHGATMVNE